MAEQRMYNAPGLDVTALADALGQWFGGQQYETQVLEVPGGLAVQARKEDTLRTISGTGAALNISLTPQGDNLFVQIGAAKWVDKAVVGVVASIIFWPLLALPAYGWYKQREIARQALAFVDQYVASGGQVASMGVNPMATPAAPRPMGAATAPLVAPVGQAQVICPACGAQVRAGAKFCDACGAKVVSECAQCGAALRPGAKFCDACGAKVEAAAS